MTQPISVSGVPLAYSPLINTVAPNGAYRRAFDHPAVPLTAAALAVDANACQDAGAAMMYMHVRDAEGRHSLDAQTYRDALLVRVTIEAAGVYKSG